MPSKLPMVSFVISQEELDIVRKYQKEHNLKSQSKAFIAIIEKGIGILEKDAEKSPPISDEEKELIQSFRQLNRDGQIALLNIVHGWQAAGLYIKRDVSRLAREA